MNIEQAKAIPLTLIFEKLALSPIKQKQYDAWYLSPWRAEKTASLHVNIKQNIWYDFGDASGGSPVDLVCHYLEFCNEGYAITDALRWLRNMTGHMPMIMPVKAVDEPKANNSKLILKDKQMLKHPALVQYLKKRGIPLSTGASYLEELRVLNTETKKTFFALGMQNEEEGYELRNPFFKGCLGTKSVSFIRGGQPKPEQIHLFEGGMDALSILSRQTEILNDDILVLNSISCLKKASPYLYDYGYKVAFTWFDNDRAGKGATLALAEYLKAQSVLHKPMNSTYAAFKDVNAWHMHKLCLPEPGL